MRLCIKRILSRLPTPLPVGMTEFETWSDSIIELLPKGLEAIPREDKQFVLASSIQHLGQNKNKVPKHYFISLMHKAAASQVAGQVFTNIKEAQKIRQAEELAAAKLAEETAKTETSILGETPN